MVFLNLWYNIATLKKYNTNISFFSNAFRKRTYIGTNCGQYGHINECKHPQIVLFLIHVYVKRLFHATEKRNFVSFDV